MIVEDLNSRKVSLTIPLNTNGNRSDIQTYRQTDRQTDYVCVSVCLLAYLSVCLSAARICIESASSLIFQHMLLG